MRTSAREVEKNATAAPKMATLLTTVAFSGAVTSLHAAVKALLGGAARRLAGADGWTCTRFGGIVAMVGRRVRVGSGVRWVEPEGRSRMDQVR